VPPFLENPGTLEQALLTSYALTIYIVPVTLERRNNDGTQLELITSAPGAQSVAVRTLGIPLGACRVREPG
jgi:hypothetical protein